MDARRTFSCLPAELLALVAEELDTRCLARFAAACAACLAAAQADLRAALLEAVKLCLEPGTGPVSNALVASPHFCLPDDLVLLPEGTFYGNTSVTELTLPAGIGTIEENAFRSCSKLVKLALPAALTTIGNDALAECSSLTELNLPVALTSLGSSSLPLFPRRRLAPGAYSASRHLHYWRGVVHELLRTRQDHPSRRPHQPRQRHLQM